MARRLIMDIEHFADEVDLVVLPAPCPLAVAPHEFGHADTLSARSLELTRSQLDQAEKVGVFPIPPHLTRLGHSA